MKEQLKATEERLAAAERHIKTRADQEQQLRDGILNARQQVCAARYHSSRVEHPFRCNTALARPPC